MPVPDSEDISRLTDGIYEAALDVGHWPCVLEHLAPRFASASAHLFIDRFAMTQGKMISSGTDPAYPQRYVDYYASRNVLWQRWVRRPLEGVITDRSVMPREELQRSEFYNDFLCPQDGEEILISVVLQRAGAAATITLWRPERLNSWRPEEMEALAVLTPHFRRALRANQRIGELRILHELAGEALHCLEHGVVLASAEAQVLFANRAAEAIFADGGGLRLDGRQMAARRIADSTALRRLIAAAAERRTGGTLAIARDDRPALAVLVIPTRAEAGWPLYEPPNAILFITDPERPAKPSLTAFAGHFGLTPAQAALAREVMKGDGVPAAAARLGISYATARSHLLQIFQKTDTRRQAELVRLLLEWTAGPAASGGGDQRIEKRG